MSYAETAAHAHYATARDAARVALLAGPYPTRRAAEAVLPTCRRLVAERYPLDMQATFATFGTARLTLRPGRPAPQGRLNVELAARA